ncbi:MAG: preprotein translocase subunit SecE [Oscillospiraceae bacterium]|nr:preprotein translocase subunit SecE [Oscillospiraceae bacterium]
MAEETKGAKKEKMKLGARIKKFFKDYRSEMKKIVWPTRPQVIQNTGVVLIAIIFIAAIVGLLDLAFGTGVIQLLGKVRELINK